MERKYDIQGMVCGSCRFKIEAHLRKIDPEASVDFLLKEAKLSDQVSQDQVIDLVDKLGYQASIK